MSGSCCSRKCFSVPAISLCSTEVSCGGPICLPSSCQSQTWQLVTCQDSCGSSSCGPQCCQPSCPVSSCAQPLCCELPFVSFLIREQLPATVCCEATNPCEPSWATICEPSAAVSSCGSTVCCAAICEPSFVTAAAKPVCSEAHFCQRSPTVCRTSASLVGSANPAGCQPVVCEPSAVQLFCTLLPACCQPVGPTLPGSVTSWLPGCLLDPSRFLPPPLICCVQRPCEPSLSPARAKSASVVSQVSALLSNCLCAQSMPTYLGYVVKRCRSSALSQFPALLLLPEALSCRPGSSASGHLPTNCPRDFYIPSSSKRPCSATVSYRPVSRPICRPICSGLFTYRQPYVTSISYRPSCYRPCYSILRRPACVTSYSYRPVCFRPSCTESDSCKRDCKKSTSSQVDCVDSTPCKADVSEEGPCQPTEAKPISPTNREAAAAQPAASKPANC
uniref:Keratin associated protein 16-1 n=1 Tax=Rhinopithecus bieti TaxID=61621 RepID=A0A2K6KJI1_RHIBE